MVPLSMTSIDPWLGFQGRNIIQGSISQKRPWLGFQGRNIIQGSISQKRHEIEPYSTGSRMRCIEWWHFQWPCRTLTWFSRSQHFWSQLSQKRCFLGTKLL